MLKVLSGVVEEEGRSRVLEERADEFKAFWEAGTLGERREGTSREESLLTRAGIELRFPFLGGMVGGLPGESIPNSSVSLIMWNDDNGRGGNGAMRWRGKANNMG
jgi:hypothetical protein